MIDFTGQVVFVTGAGRVGLGEGWLAEPGSFPSADDIAAHLTDVSTIKSFTVPTSIFDEVVGVCSRLGITG